MTTTTVEAGLLHAIRLHPAEDTPRLAYADWLDENSRNENCSDCRGRGWVQVSDGPYGYDRSPAVCDSCSGTGQVSDGFRERAEFIRVQIEIERLHQSTSAFNPGARLATIHGPIYDLRQRERVLWREWHNRWFGWGGGTDNFGSALTPNEVDPRVRRGFVFEVRLPVAAFLDAAPGLFSTHPIERVVLTDREPEGIGYETFWRWFMAGELPRFVFVSEDPSVLPEAIWRLFHDHPPYSTSSIRRTLGWEFVSRDEAMAALSTACVAYGRELAALPPLTTDPQT